MRSTFGTALRPILAALPAMQEKRSGRIAIIASIGGRLGVPHLAPYSAAKFALVGFAEALQAEAFREIDEVAYLHRIACEEWDLL